MSDDLDQSLDANSEFIYFKGKDLDQSLVGTSQKVYFANASQINRVELEKAKQEEIKLKPPPLMNQIDEEEEQENQFLNVSKWKKNKPVQLSEQMVKIHEQVEAKITQTKWGKSEKNIKTQENIIKKQTQTKNISKVSNNSNISQIKEKESSLKWVKKENLKQSPSSQQNEKSLIMNKDDELDAKEDQFVSEQVQVDEPQEEQQENKQEEQEQEQEQQQEEQEEQEEEQEEQEQQQEEQEEEQEQEEQSEENEEQIEEQQEQENELQDTSYREEATQNFSEMKTTNQAVTSKWIKKSTKNEQVPLQAHKIQQLIPNSPQKPVQKNWANLQQIILRIQKLVS